MRNVRPMVQSVRAFSAVVAVIATSLVQPVVAETSRSFPWVAGELAACRPSANGCECSFTSMETILTFGDAAESVLFYYTQAQAADEYPALMSNLLRQCLGQVVAPIVFPFGSRRTATGMEAVPKSDRHHPLASTAR